MILVAVCALAIFVGGFLTGVGLFAWWHTAQPWEMPPDPSNEAGA